mgnify:CR=1 FL=1
MAEKSAFSPPKDYRTPVVSHFAPSHPFLPHNVRRHVGGVTFSLLACSLCRTHPAGASTSQAPWQQAPHEEFSGWLWWYAFWWWGRYKQLQRCVVIIFIISGSSFLCRQWLQFSASPWFPLFCSPLCGLGDPVGPSTCSKYALPSSCFSLHVMLCSLPLDFMRVRPSVGVTDLGVLVFLLVRPPCSFFLILQHDCCSAFRQFWRLL